MWKAFWRSLGADIHSLFFGHWLRMIGVMVAYFVPVALLIAEYATRKPGSWEISGPVVAWLVAIPCLVVYWAKINAALKRRLTLFKAVNEVDASKHYAMIVIFTFLRHLMGAATILVAYETCRVFEAVFKAASDGFMLMLIFYCLGAFLFVLDAVFTRAPKATQITAEGDAKGIQR